MYGFLFATLIQYRKLCHEWSAWLTKVPRLTATDVEEWYSAKLGETSSDSNSTMDSETESLTVLSQRAFAESVQAYTQRRRGAPATDPVVARAARGLPYAMWLLRKSHPEDEAAIPQPFSTTWFAELKTALNTQQQLSRGLKEHSPFMLFRHARFDVSIDTLLKSFHQVHLN
jgi:hypothetical protein